MRRVPPSCQGNHLRFVFLTTRGRVSPSCASSAGQPLELLPALGCWQIGLIFSCSFLACAALVNISKHTESAAPRHHPQTYHSLCEHADVMSSFLNRFFELFIVVYYFYK